MTVIDISAVSELEGRCATFIVKVIYSITNCEGTCCSVVEDSGSKILFHCPVVIEVEHSVVAEIAGPFRAAKLTTSLLGKG